MRAAGRARLHMLRAEQVDGSVDGSRGRGLADRSSIIGVPFVHQGADATDEGGVDAGAGVGRHRHGRHGFRRSERGSAGARGLDMANARELRDAVDG